MDDTERMFVLLINNQKPKQIEVFKRKWNTYQYIVTRKNIAQEKPFIITIEYVNIPNSSRKKLETDVVDLEKKNMVLIERKPYKNPITKKTIPRAQFIFPIVSSTKDQTFTQLIDHYLNSFVQENDEEQL